MEVRGTPNQGAAGSVATSLIGHGEDIVSVGDGSGHLSGVQGTLNIANPIARSSVTVDGSAEPGKQAVTISSGAISGIAPASITYDANDLSNIDLMGGTGGNTFQIVGTRFRAPAGPFTHPSTELPVTIDGGAGANTLIGPDVASTWNVQSRDAGSVGAVTFSRIGSLTGGALADTFALAQGTSLSGGVDGGGSVNTLDLSALRRSVVVNLTAGTATAIGGKIANISNVLGGRGNNLLVGDDKTNTLQGGGGRNILIGGGGVDQVQGESGDNILIGSVTSFDLEPAALDALMQEFARTDENFVTRLAHLLSGDGENADTLLNPTTVQNSADNERPRGRTGKQLVLRPGRQRPSSSPARFVRAMSSRNSEPITETISSRRRIRFVLGIGASHQPFPGPITMTRLSRLNSRGPWARRRPIGLRLESLESRQLLANFTVLNTS